MNPEERQGSSRVPIARLIVLAVLAGLLALQTGFTAWSLFTVGGRTPLLLGAGVPRGGGYDNAPAGHWADLVGVRARRGIRFNWVDSVGPMGCAGLRAGDLLIEVGDREVVRHPGAYFEMLYRGRTGQAVPLVWRRDGVELRGTLILPIERLERWGSGTKDWVFRPFYSAAAATWLAYGSGLFTYLLLLLLGIGIGFRRPGDRMAFLFAATMMALGLEEMNLSMPLLASWPIEVVTVLAVATSAGGAAVVVLFMQLLAVFPHPTRFGAKVLRWRWLVALAFGLRALGETIYDLGQLHPSLKPRFEPLLDLRAGDITWWLLAAVLLLGSLFIAQRIETRGMPRRRLRAVELGIGMMIGAELIAGVLQILPLSRSYTLFAVRWYVGHVTVLALSAGIAVLAYGVVAHRMFSLRFALRRGLQHLLLSRGVLVAEFGVLFLIVIQVLRGARFEFSESVPAVASLALTTSALAVMGLGRANRPLMGAIDRRFFREACDARHVLVGLGEQVAGLAEREAIVGRAGETVLAALHSTRTGFYVLDGRDGASPRLAWGRWQRRAAGARPGAPAVVEESEPGPEDLARVQGALAQLGAGRQWMDYPPTREEADAPLDLTKPAPYELVLPVRAGSELLGCLALAVKLSQEPYSREDRELLQGVAQAVGMALKNAALVEVAKREAQQAKELEIARTVQQGLFPKALPAVAGWELAATCRPARAVGGDYYDVFDLSPGRVAVALGDVSGKGLGASLLMSNLHALMRSRLRQSAGDLGAFMGEVNEHLVASSPEGMFVTLCLGVLDTATGDLRYVNAGHPPGLVVCGETGEVTRLEQGGLIAGALAGARYEEGRVVLLPGGVLAIYSDGVTEAVDAGGEMYEEERLIAALRERAGSGARGALDGVLASVDAFSAGVEQADDITLVVARRLGGATPSPRDSAMLGVTVREG